MSESTIDAARLAALREIDARERKARRTVIAFLLGVTVLEAGGILALVLMLDFKDPLHRVLGVMCGFLYVTLAGWIVVVWAAVRHSTQAILKAIAAGSAG